MPTEPDDEVSSWLRIFGLTPRERETDVRVLGIRGEDGDQGTVVTGETILAEVVPPTGSRAWLRASVPGGGTVTTDSFENSRFAYLRPGGPTVVLEAPTRTALTVQLRPPPTLDELREELRAVPRLTVYLGDREISSWSEPVTVDHLANIKLSVGTAAANLRLIVTSRFPGGLAERRTNLSLDEAEVVLRDAADKGASGLTVDAGNLGRVVLSHRPVEAAEPLTSGVPRAVATWLVASTRSGALRQEAARALHRGLAARRRRRHEKVAKR